MKDRGEIGVGDQVIGNREADKYYSITGAGWTGVVRAVDPDGVHLEVSKNSLTPRFLVRRSCFDRRSKKGGSR